MDHRDQSQSGPSDAVVLEEEAREVLLRLIANPAFKATERNRRFLSFVSEEMLAGRGELIKAYSIAVDVFGRPESFDPSTDPIVRIEATRLRASLVSYYENEGAREPVRIDLPKGRYIPVFLRLSGSGDATPHGRVPEDEGPAPALLDADPTRPGETTTDPSVLETSPHPYRPLRRLRAWWLPVGAGAVAAVGMYFISHGEAGPVEVTERPWVTIALRERDQADQADAAVVRDSLTVALSRFQTLRLVPDSPSTTGGNGEDARSPRTARYRIDLKLVRKASNSGIWWQVVDLSSQEVVASNLQHVASSADEDEFAIGAVANDVAGQRGAIVTRSLVREMESPTLGNGCVVRAGLAIRSRAAVSLETARRCLERTLETVPNDADVLAMLSMVLIQMDMPERPTKLVPEALLLARRAAELDPASDRAALALVGARFRNGQIEAALSACGRAGELNAYNAVVAAQCGALMFVIGREEEGLRLVAKAEGIGGDANPEVLIVKALDAYRHRQFDEALRYLNRMDDPFVFGQGYVRLATLGQLGLLSVVEEELSSSGRSRDELARTFYPAMAGRHVNGPLVEDLRTGLVRVRTH